MNPNHVTSLELSKKLKESGYKQEGEFFWQYNGKDGIKLEIGKYCVALVNKYPKTYGISKKDCIAPLASELMERLPSPTTCISKGVDVYRLIINKENNDYVVSYSYLETFKDDNLCNALAKMYIYLAENKLLEEK